MAFKFETANERWKNYKQSMDWERDDNGNAVSPSNWALGFPDAPDGRSALRLADQIVQSAKQVYPEIEDAYRVEPKEDGYAVLTIVVYPEGYGEYLEGNATGAEMGYGQV